MKELMDFTANNRSLSVLAVMLITLVSGSLR